MASFLEESLNLFEYTRELRRDFHSHPELGFQEVRTAGIVARQLAELDLEVVTGIAKTGVVGLLEGGHPGPVLMLRFDMDALPILEATGAAYASRYPGVMHACGHDGHVAIGLTVARMLKARAEELAGTVKFVFQPAEEGLGGAAAMIKEGVLENPRPQFCMALHLWNEKPLGWLGIAPGPVMAAAEIFKVRVIGKGGHGASPHLSIDPVVAAAHIVSALQSITSRNVPPLESAVVSVTSLHGGEAFNVIPQQVELLGTIRTFTPEVRQKVLERFHQVVQGVASATQCEAQVEVTSITPPVVNDAYLAGEVQSVARRVRPDDVLDVNFQSMVSEDMAFIMQEIPGCFFFIGSANPARGLDAPHHHPRFDIDEDALPRAAVLMAEAAIGFLHKEMAQ